MPVQVAKTNPPVDLLWELLDPDFDTGGMRWRTRFERHFQTARHPKRACGTWNGRYANTPAFQQVGANGYFYGYVNNQMKLAHRVIWALHSGEWPDLYIDHVNGHRSDNCISNLRLVSPSENQKNRRYFGGTPSGVMGVYWHKRAKRWHAQIRIEGKQTYLGLFDTVEEAREARLAAEKKHGYGPTHGKLADV